ncbi:nuclear envelope integral membrane protein-like [Amblyomma americanum]
MSTSLQPLAAVLLVMFAEVSFGHAASDAPDLLDDGRSSSATTLHEGHLYVMPRGRRDEMIIYCYPGDPVRNLAIFKSIYVEFKHVPERFKLFEGPDEASVRAQFSAHLASWVPLLPWRQSTISLSAFRPHCFGLVSEDDYRFELVVRQANYWRVLQFAASAVLFFGVPALCRNALVFYTCGVSVGVLASLLIAVFVVSRLLPRRAAGYSVIFFGWSLVLYLLQLLWSNVYQVLAEYKSVLAGYIAFTALLSFAICYRVGPPTNPRTLNLIQWSLQLVALAGVVTSSEMREATGAAVLVMLTAYNFPPLWKAKLRTWWRTRVCRPKVTLLTEEEYILQGDIETRRALESLREYCSSPDCKTWQVVTRLRDPVRFAKFVQGQSHLSDEEVLHYEVDSPDCTPNDEDSLMTEDEQPSFTELADGPSASFSR